MKCLTARKLISGYIDNDLKPNQISSLEQHLESCPNCKKLLKDFRKIANRSKELEKLSPPGQTWFKIQAGLREEKQVFEVPSSRKREWFIFYPVKLRYAFSAALLLVVIASVVIFGPKFWNRGRVLPETNRQQYALAKLEEAEHHYQLAIKALWEAVSSQEESFDPQVAEVFRTNLNIINASISACKQAVLSEPDNLEARNYLLAAYRGKMDFLDKMMAVKALSSQERELKTSI